MVLDQRQVAAFNSAFFMMVNGAFAQVPFCHKHNCSSIMHFPELDPVKIIPTRTMFMTSLIFSKEQCSRKFDSICWSETIHSFSTSRSLSVFACPTAEAQVLDLVVS